MGTYIRTVECDNAYEKERSFFEEKNKYISNDTAFIHAPGASYAYWINEKYLNAYGNSEKIEKYITTFQGIISGNNETMLHFWHEMDADKIPFSAKEMCDVDLSKQYWIPYNKGGRFRKWYGIQDYVIYWKNGPDDKTRGKKGFSKYYLQPYVSWSYTVANQIATRFYQSGFLWDVRGSGIFGEYEDIIYLMAFISSKPAFEFFKIDSSVMSCQVENIQNLPTIIDAEQKNEIVRIAEENIDIAKDEWDSYEISWNFNTHPLVKEEYAKMPSLIEERFKEYQDLCQKRFERMKKNEEALNAKFIKIYGLEGELESDVKDEDITLEKADLNREIKSLISYAVGCIFGRYSLKEEGLQAY